jgi:hypothetical protein
MTDYKTIFLKGKEFRYYCAERIEHEAYNVKDNWRPIAICDNKNIYKLISFTFNGKNRKVLLHRIIYFVNNPDWDIDDVKQKIDHIIHPENQPLDNSISNLRCVSQQQNTFNRNALGVTWIEKKKKWKAQICINGKVKNLGCFVEKEDAIIAYQNAKLVHHIIPS